MAILTEGTRKAEFIVSEANDYRSRDAVTVTVASGGFEAGTILGEVTATGKFVRHDTSLTNGAEAEAAVLFAPLAEAGDVEATVITRDAEVDGSKLTYEDGAGPSQIITSNAALAALGIIVRR